MNLRGAALLLPAVLAACSAPEPGVLRGEVVATVCRSFADGPVSVLPPRPNVPPGLAPAAAPGARGVVVSTRVVVPNAIVGCADAWPVEHELVILDEHGARLWTIRTAADGSFEAALPPGRYLVRSAEEAFPYIRSTAVEVASGRTTAVQLLALNVIRVPGAVNR